MKMTFETDDNNISFSCENTNEYEPYNDKERRITLHALTAEKNRAAVVLARERNADRIEQLASDMRAISELIDIFECGNSFAVTREYKRLLLAALSREKKHRKAARRISAEIQRIPSFCSLEIGGFDPFSDII